MTNLLHAYKMLVRAFEMYNLLMCLQKDSLQQQQETATDSKANLEQQVSELKARNLELSQKVR